MRKSRHSGWTFHGRIDRAPHGVDWHVELARLHCQWRGNPFREALDELDALLPLARQRGLRGYFIVGENDFDISQAENQWFFEKLKSAGIVCEIETVPGATHDHTPAYDEAFYALTFISNTDN